MTVEEENTNENQSFSDMLLDMYLEAAEAEINEETQTSQYEALLEMYLDEKDRTAVGKFFMKLFSQVGVKMDKMEDDIDSMIKESKDKAITKKMVKLKNDLDKLRSMVRNRRIRQNLIGVPT